MALSKGHEHWLFLVSTDDFTEELFGARLHLHPTIWTRVLNGTTTSITNGALARLPPRTAVRFSNPFEGAVDVFASSSPRGLSAATASVFPAHGFGLVSNGTTH